MKIRVLTWLALTLFIFGTVFPLITSFLFCKNVTKKETKVAPITISTYVSYESKKEKLFHTTSNCSYVGKSIVSTVYESLNKEYRPCSHCFHYSHKLPTKTIVEKETVTKKNSKEYNFLYPIAICSAVSSVAFIFIVLLPLKKHSL